jgi:DNA repair exonuclease SbcCD ATPase subunit
MPIVPDCFESYQAIEKEIIVLENELKTLKRELTSLKIADKCSACGQTIDNSHLIKLRTDLLAKIEEKTSLLNSSKALHEEWAGELLKYEAEVKLYKLNQQKIERFEQLSQLIDKTMPTEYPDHNLLSVEQTHLTELVSIQTKKQNDAITYNKRVSAHNAKIEALKEQKVEFLIRQDTLKKDILNKSNQVTYLNILKKAFSTSGIVAFKLENLTKELETSINYYLSTLSDGQFQVEFSLDKEKLNINVINNGISASIETVSGGEFSRIQTSILLAIRSLLSKLGGSSINLLFLDEITGVLDEEGKEKLVEVLQREQDLNVFLISHDFTHPLIDKISIIKENNISAIAGI